MLTLKDIELMKRFFPTKEEYSDFKHDLNNDLLTFKDEIITEIKDLRLETDVNSSFRNSIEKQDKRIDRLESALFN